MLVARVDEGERLARAVDEERQADEDHRQHDAGDVLGEGDAERLEEPPDDALPAVDGEQGDPGGGVGEDDRQVDDALDHALAGELLAREQVRERHADREADDGGDERRDHREDQGAAHVVLPQGLAQEAGAGAGDHARRRQRHERDEDDAGHGAERPERRHPDAHQAARVTAPPRTPASPPPVRPPGRPAPAA